MLSKKYSNIYIIGDLNQKIFIMITDEKIIFFMNNDCQKI